MIDLGQGGEGMRLIDTTEMDGTRITINADNISFIRGYETYTRVFLNTSDANYINFIDVNDTYEVFQNLLQQLQ